ncbi:MAG: MFS transporter [Candidatus Eisenbacteria bacterium]|nr:MFS transporter [Candidatus Eisenbacteria bacterium]
MRAWCLYDWANSAFATTVMAAILPLWYARSAAAGLPPGRATAYWGYTTGASLALAAILSPLAGAWADGRGARKKTLLLFAAAGALATALLATVGRGDWLRASLLYPLAHVPFVIATVCYDALLPHVARSDDMDRVSARGFALGYLGGGLLLALNTAMVLRPGLFHLPSTGAGVRLSFITVSIWWVLFTIPLARRIDEPPRAADNEGTGAAIDVFRRLLATLGEIRRNRNALLFLIAFWLYSDGIGTIIKMAVVYGAEVGIGRSDLIGALLLVQFVGVPCSTLFGRAARRTGARAGILFGLAVYAAIAIGALFLSRPWHFWALALGVGAVQGGTQALSRSLFASIAPARRSAAWFGFYSTSARFAGIAGPLLFALTGQITGSSRFGTVPLLLFFTAGAALLARVRPGRVE